MAKIRVGIIGVGNCASSLVQGVRYYRDADEDTFVPGIMHVNLGGYHIRDIEFSTAIDIDKNKVGKDLSEAIYTRPNNTYKFCDVPRLKVPVVRGMTHDGLGKYLKEIITPAPGSTIDVAEHLRKTGTDLVISYLPVGSEEATKWYVEQILEAGCGFINAIPVFIAREPYWQARFKRKGLPMIGDDIKSQVGSTIVHRVLTRLFRERGVRLERTYQLNVGGNTDFLNMLERERLESKKISKTNAVTSQLDYDLGKGNVHIGPSDYIEWLADRKWAYIRMEGRTFGDVPLMAELKLEVWDSPNSAGVMIDAIRCLKLALDNGLSGTLEGPSAYFKKSPPVQHTDEQARQMVEDFIATYGKSRARSRSGKTAGGRGGAKTAKPTMKAKTTRSAAKTAKPARSPKSGRTPRRTTRAEVEHTVRTVRAMARAAVAAKAARARAAQGGAGAAQANRGSRNGAASRNGAGKTRAKSRPRAVTS